MNNIKTTQKIIMMIRLITMRIFIRKNIYWLLEDTEINPNFHQEKDKYNYEDSSEKNYTQDMRMEHPEEEIILYDDEDKDYDVIDKEEVYCAGVRLSIRLIGPVERL